MALDKDSVQMLNAVLQNAPPIPDEELAGAVQHKKHAKPKKKDSSLLCGNEITDIIKSNSSSEEKLRMVCNKYSEVLHSNRKLMMAYKMSEGKIAKLQQENEQCQQQRSKVVLQRSRLENLCRELQKLNKAQKEEIDLKLRLEEEKRKEISATFQSAFAEMSTLTSQNTEKNTKMREENLEMREKIKSVRERIELSEQQLEKVRQHAQLELQLAEAKMAAVKMEMTAEKECLLKEKQQLLLKLTEYQVKISELQATEVGLRSQINMYTEKYDDFQNALAKSNEVFNGFNEEMEKMSKKIAKSEKETNLWKQRWEKSHVALLEMAADKHTRDTEMEKLNHKVSLLQELCKAFQRERAELLAQLRAKTTANAQEEAKIVKETTKSEEELPEDCQKLKNDLDQLQKSLDEEKSRPKQVDNTTETTTENKIYDNKLSLANNSETNNQTTNEVSKESIETNKTESLAIVHQNELTTIENETNINEDCIAKNGESTEITKLNLCELAINTSSEELKNNEILVSNQQNAVENENSIKKENAIETSETTQTTVPEKLMFPELDSNQVFIEKNENLVQTPVTLQNTSDTEQVTSMIDPKCVTEVNPSGLSEVRIDTEDEINNHSINKETVLNSTQPNNINSSKKGKDGKRKK